MGKQTREQEPEIVDTSDLTDEHWTEINKLRAAFKKGGNQAFWKAIDRLGKKDPIMQTAVLFAYFPDVVRETIKDQMAEQGVTREDLLELLEKAKNRPNGQKHH